MDIFKSWLVTQPIAHRGLHNNEDIPENSIKAFGKAIEKNYPIEIDVRIIDDGTVVVFHDDKLSRMTAADSYICKSKYKDLENLRLLKTDEKIPTLRETLDFVDGRVPLLIEIKNEAKTGKLEKEVLDILKTYKGEYAIQSFNPYSVEYFRLFAPHVLRGQLSSAFRGSKMSFFRRHVLSRMLLNSRVSKPDFIAYEHTDLPNRYVRKYMHLPILAWTIKSNTDYENVKSFCNNIIFEGFAPQK